jgi:hypothetical protein
MATSSRRRSRSLNSTLDDRLEEPLPYVATYHQTLWGTNADKYLKDWRSNLRPEATHDYTYDNRRTSSDWNEIRLIRLYPAGNRNAPLVCDLRVASLDDNPEYSALSYCWGDPIFEHELVCEGKTFLITAQLSAALRQIRLLEPDRRDLWQALWVDQICIDQKDEHDKSQQVQLMRRIYSQARRVFINLGEQTELTNAGLDLATNVWVYREARYQRLPGADTDTLHVPWTPEIEAQLKGLGNVISRPWFRRVWIIQEVAACKHRTFMCGSTFFEWPVLEAAVDCGFGDHFIIKKRIQLSEGRWHDTNHSIRELFYTLQNTIANVEQNNLPGFVDLLTRSKAFDATNERDKLYSLLGLARDATSLPTIDYSTPWELVYQDFAKAIIEQGRTRYLFNNAGLRNSSLDLPSWVPDWRHPPYLSFYDQIAPFRETPSDDISAVIVGDPNRPPLLVVPAATISKIHHIAPPFTPPMSCQAVLSLFESTMDMIAPLCASRTQSPVPEAADPTQDASVPSPSEGQGHTLIFEDPGTSSSIQDPVHLQALAVLAVILTLDGGASWKYTGNELGYLMECLEYIAREGAEPGLHESQSRKSWTAFGAPGTVEMGMKTYRRSPSTKDTAGEASVPAALGAEKTLGGDKEKEAQTGDDTTSSGDDCRNVLKSPTFERYWNFAAQTLYHRRVFVTENNLVGIGPDVAEPGDIVTLMPGSPVPYILRPVRGTNGDVEDREDVMLSKLVGDAWVSGIAKYAKHLRIRGVIVV